MNDFYDFWVCLKLLYTFTKNNRNKFRILRLFFEFWSMDNLQGIAKQFSITTLKLLYFDGKIFTNRLPFPFIQITYIRFQINFWDKFKHVAKLFYWKNVWFYLHDALFPNRTIILNGFSFFIFRRIDKSQYMAWHTALHVLVQHKKTKNKKSVCSVSSIFIENSVGVSVYLLSHAFTDIKSLSIDCI